MSKVFCEACGGAAIQTDGRRTLQSAHYGALSSRAGNAMCHLFVHLLTSSSMLPIYIHKCATKISDLNSSSFRNTVPTKASMQELSCGSY